MKSPLSVESKAAKGSAPTKRPKLASVPEVEDNNPDEDDDIEIIGVVRAKNTVKYKERHRFFKTTIADFHVEIVDRNKRPDVSKDFAAWCRDLRAEGLRPKGWSIKGETKKSGADIVLLQLGTGYLTSLKQDSPPPWNRFQAEALKGVSIFAQSFLVDDGLLCIIHSGSLAHSNSIFDLLGPPKTKEECGLKHIRHYFIWNDSPSYGKHTKCSVSSHPYIVHLSAASPEPFSDPRQIVLRRSQNHCPR